MECFGRTTNWLAQWAPTRLAREEGLSFHNASKLVSKLNTNTLESSMSGGVLEPATKRSTPGLLYLLTGNRQANSAESTGKKSWTATENGHAVARLACAAEVTTGRAALHQPSGYLKPTPSVKDTSSYLLLLIKQQNGALLEGQPVTCLRHVMMILFVPQKQSPK